ncbi:MAG: response regulator transcription factor [Chitinophagaceae bacterium]|nr:response regulator transcription factor [Chitinophagaceae bacterium]
MRNSKVSVLIVDDHAYFAKSMKNMLDEVEEIDSVDLALNFNDGLRMLEAQQHDVVLLDISMPGKNGLDLLQEIQNKSLDCTVIVLSNMSANYYRQECKRLGASYFLDKSCEFDLVPGIISSVQLN